jgi:hypothetical protein
MICPIGYCTHRGEDCGAFCEDIDVLATAGVADARCKTHLWMEGVFWCEIRPGIGLRVDLYWNGHTICH